MVVFPCHVCQTPLQAEEAPGGEFPNYEAGSWGPQASDDMLARDGRRWRRL